MTWDELLKILESYRAEGADLTGIVVLNSYEEEMHLDLVESCSSGKLVFIPLCEPLEDGDD